MSNAKTVTPADVEKTRAWLKSFYAADETLVARNWLTTFFYPDAAITFNNETPVKGHDAMIAYYDHFNSMFSKMDHILQHLEVLPDRLYIQLQVDLYPKKDPEQKPFTAYSCVVCDKKLDEDKVSFYNIYADVASLKEYLKKFE